MSDTTRCEEHEVDYMMFCPACRLAVRERIAEMYAEMAHLPPELRLPPAIDLEMARQQQSWALKELDRTREALLKLCDRVDVLRGSVNHPKDCPCVCCEADRAREVLGE